MVSIPKKGLNHSWHIIQNIREIKEPKKRIFEKIGEREFFIISRVTETEVDNRTVGTKVVTTSEVASNSSNCFWKYCQFNPILSPQ